MCFDLATRRRAVAAALRRRHHANAPRPTASPPHAGRRRRAVYVAWKAGDDGASWPRSRTRATTCGSDESASSPRARLRHLADGRGRRGVHDQRHRRRGQQRDRRLRPPHGRRAVAHALRRRARRRMPRRCVWKSPDGQPLMLMSTMSKGLTAYDPATGEIVWNAFTHDLPDRCVSSPIVAGDMVLISCGSGNNGMHLIGARAGRRATSRRPRSIGSTRASRTFPRRSSAGDLVFLWYDRGDRHVHRLARRARCTGASAWAATFTVRRVRVGDRIFCISLDGEVVVLAAQQGVRAARPQPAGRARHRDAGGRRRADADSHRAVAHLPGGQAMSGSAADRRRAGGAGSARARALQLAKLNELLAAVVPRNPFYAAKLQQTPAAARERSTNSPSCRSRPRKSWPRPSPHATAHLSGRATTCASTKPRARTAGRCRCSTRPPTGSGGSTAGSTCSTRRR